MKNTHYLVLVFSYPTMMRYMLFIKNFNGSDDRLKEIVKEQLQKVNYIKPDENIFVYLYEPSSVLLGYMGEAITEESSTMMVKAIELFHNWYGVHPDFKTVIEDPSYLKQHFSSLPDMPQSFIKYANAHPETLEEIHNLFNEFMQNAMLEHPQTSADAV